MSLITLWCTSEPPQVPNVTDRGLKPRQVKKVAIIGGGLMGSGIATALILSNIHVVLKEINAEYLQRGTKMIEGSIFHVNSIISALRFCLSSFWEISTVAHLFHFCGRYCHWSTSPFNCFILIF